MKKYLILLLFSAFSFAGNKDSLAVKINFKNYYLHLMDDDCDACGCSASGGSMGFASMLNSNFVGVRYFYQQYKSRNGLYSNAPWYNENYNTSQIWARIPIFNKFQLSFLVPYHNHNRDTSIGNQEISGIGDITLLVMYRLYQTDKDSTVFVHTIQVGGGIKAPTGTFDASNNTGSVNQSFQLGTGSWDYQLVSEYVIKHKNFGLNAMINYTIKTNNSNFYQYGNQFNYSGTFFYLYEKSKLSIAPQLGFSGEVYETNLHHKQIQKNTEGDILFSKLGFEMGYKKLSLGMNTMIPINQHLAAGNIEANYRWSVNLNYSL